MIEVVFVAYIVHGWMKATFSAITIYCTVVFLISGTCVNTF